MKPRLSQQGLRIQTGQQKGIKLWSPQISSVRPTPAKIREAFANILSSWSLEDSILLDCFAGSGAVGFELLSRGLSHCVFIEKNPLALECLFKNRNLHESFLTRSTIINNRGQWNFEILQKGLPEKKKIVFADPPYTIRPDLFEEQQLAQIWGLEKGFLFWQRDENTDPLSLEGKFRFEKSYPYGRHRLDFFSYDPTIPPLSE